MSRQAIVTKWHACGNVVGTRMSATAAAGRKYYAYDHGANLEDNHKAAARSYAAELEWRGDWFTGTLPDGRYVHVNSGD